VFFSVSCFVLKIIIKLNQQNNYYFTMAKAKIKKKPVKKISKIKKRSVSRPKKKIKEISSEIIFDSTVGKTDSLFVDNPAEAVKVSLAQMPATQIVPNIYEDLCGMGENQKTVQKKKSFWQKFFLFFSDN
jgi:hypothetical protein